MTKQQEIEIVKKLGEKYPELKAKNCIVGDGLFRKGSDKKILSIITDDNDKIQFHICNELRNKRKNIIVEKIEEKVEEKDKKVEEKVEEQIKEETTDEELNEILELDESKNNLENEYTNDKIPDDKLKNDYDSLLIEYNKLKAMMVKLENKMIDHEHYKKVYQCCICHGN